MHVIGELKILFSFSFFVGFSSSTYRDDHFMFDSLISVQQTGPPRITFSKRQFTIGENLVANCTTSKAHPAPHITWLINGKLVSRTIYLFQYRKRKRKRERKRCNNVTIINRSSKIIICTKIQFRPRVYILGLF